MLECADVMEWVGARFGKTDLDDAEIARAVEIGIAAVLADRPAWTPARRQAMREGEADAMERYEDAINNAAIRAECRSEGGAP
jgi:hypothetical protein